MNADFVTSQLRTLLLATVAYEAGTGRFTPEGSTLAGTFITILLPIAVPWLMSLYANMGVIKVSSTDKAAAIATVIDKVPS